MSNKHGHSGPNQNGGEEQKRKVSGDIHVRGEILVNAPPEEKLAAQTAQNNKESRENTRLLLEKITLAVLTVYAGLTLWLAISSQSQSSAASISANATMNTFESASRPYLFGKVTAEMTDNPVNMVVVSTVKNYGSIPTEDISFQWKVYVDGLWLPVNEPGEATTVLEPADSMITKIPMGTKESPPILKAEKPLYVYLSYRYGWRDKQEHKCQKFAYAAQTKAFMTVGNKCDTQ